MRSNNAFLTTSLFLTLTAGCGLIKVNGKALGGGSSTSSAMPDRASASDSSSSSESSSSSSSSSTTSEATCSGRFGSDYHECVAKEDRRKAAIADAPFAAARAKLPKWCKERHFSETQKIELDSFKDVMDPKHDIFHATVPFGEAMCAIRGEGLDLKPKVMEIRAKWMKLHGMDELDFEVAVGLQQNRTWGSQDYKTLGPAVAQMDYVTALKLDELGAKVSMLGAFAWAKTCMGGMREGNSGHPLTKIPCVVEPLDAAKAYAEIEAAPGINPETRFNLRQLVHDTAGEQARFKTAVAALQKEEPAVGKLIAIAEQQRKEWTQPSAARAKLIALVEQMEQATAANKRSVFTGCDTSTHAAWAEVVRSRELPSVATKDTRDSMRAAVFTTADAYLAYRALDLCMAGLATETRSRDRIGSSIVRRGWRTSTIAEWLAASGQIKFDSRGLDIGMVVGNAGRESTSYANAEAGTIAKLTPKGSKIVVEFKEVIEEYEDCIDWVPTNKINKIDSSGNIYYVNKCTKVGMVKNDRTPANVEMDAVFATGLKPGMRLYTDGAAIVATANAKSSKPVWLFGVSLK